LLVVFLFFVVLVIDAVVQLSIVIRLVLPVDLFDLGGKFHYSLVYHQVLYTVMVVKILINMGASRVEWSQDNTLGRYVFHQ